MNTLSIVPEWAISNTRVAYPFMPVPDLVAAGDVRTLFADAYITYGGSVAAEPIALSELRYSGTPASFGITLVDDNGDTFFSSNTPLAYTQWGNWLTLVWEDEGGSSSSSLGASSVFKQVKVLLDMTRIADFTFPVTGTAYSFVPRCVEWRGNGVTSFRVQNLPFAVSDSVYADDLLFRSGYSAAVTAGDDSPALGGFVAEASVRPSSRITFSAGATLGLGQEALCEEVLCGSPPHSVIRSINGIGPDQKKNFVLSGDPCLWLERPATDTGYSSMTIGTLRLHNGCGVCCACADYVNDYNILRRGWSTLADAHNKLSGAAGEYNALVARLNAALEDSEGVCASLKLTAKPGWTVHVQVVLTNNTRCTIEGCTVNVDLTNHNDAMPVGDAFLYLPRKERVIAGSGGFSTSYPLKTGTFIVYEYELYYPEGARSDGMPITANMVGMIGSHAVEGSAVATLQKSFNKDTKVT